MSTLRASVVVATRNRPERLRECLEALVDQTLPAEAYEIIVVDDASDRTVTDVISHVETRAPLLRIEGLRAAHRLGMAGARNAGIARCRAPSILFIDDDAVPGRDWIEQMLKGLEGRDGVGGGWIPLDLTLWSDFDQAYTLYHYGEHNEHTTGPGGQNMAFTAQTLTLLNGFDPRFRSGADDADINHRARLRNLELGHTPGARVRHWSATSLQGFCHKRISRGRAAFDFHHKFAGPRAFLRPWAKLALAPLALPLLLWRSVGLAWALGRPLRTFGLFALIVLDWVLSASGEAVASLEYLLSFPEAVRRSVEHYGRRNGIENAWHHLGVWPRRYGSGSVVLVGPRFSRSYGKMNDEIHQGLAEAGLLGAWFSGAHRLPYNAPVIVVQDRELTDLLPELPEGRLKPRIILKRECPHIDEVDAVMSEEIRMRGIDPGADSQLERLRARDEYEAADAFLVPSRLVRDSFIRTGVASHRIGVVPCGIDHRWYQPVERHRRGPRTVLFLGLMGLRKGVLTLLEAWMSLDPSGARLVLAGAVEEEIRGLMDPVLKRPDVTLISRPSDSRARQLLQHADVFCLPSLSDGFGLAALEGMACGAVPIVSDRTGLAEHVTPRIGRIVRPRDPSNLATALDELLGLGLKDLEKLAHRARQTSLEFTWDRYRRETRTFIRGFLEDPPPGESKLETRDS